MSLTFPSVVGKRASSEAQENLVQLLHVDFRGRKDQVATRVALECFQQMQALRPGYFEGVKSWAKAGGVYVLGATAAASGFGLLGWTLYKAGVIAYRSGHEAELAVLGATLGVGEFISCELGFRPVAALLTFLAVAVRDAANRAAGWSLKNDGKMLQRKENEAKECHQTIIDQLSAVYDDSAKKMREMFAEAEEKNLPDRLLALQQMADKLEEQLPLIRKFLQGFNLGNHEIANLLQKLTDTVRFARVRGCQLKPYCDERNMGIIAGCPKSSIGKMAIPIDIQERIIAANQSRLTVVERLKGYGGSVWSGGKTFAGLAAGLAVLAAAYSSYRYGVVSSCQQLVKLFPAEKWYIPTDTRMKVILGGASLGVTSAATAVAARKSWHHHCDIMSNREYVETGINRCKGDLKTIYDGMKHALERLDAANKRKTGAALQERMSDIKQAIRDQGIDPAEITGNLESAIHIALRQVL